jgi:hypothetical protein
MTPTQLAEHIAAEHQEVCDTQGCGQTRGEFLALDCAEGCCPENRLLCLDCAHALGYEIH